MEQVKCYCNLIAEEKTSHSQDNFKRIFYRCPKKLKAEQCTFWSWVEDLPLTQHIGTESPAASHWQACPSTPVKNMKRNASSMQELSDSQVSPSQKRLKLIEVALANKGSSDHSGPSITSPNAAVNNARNESAPQPSPSVGLNANSAAALPQTPTKSATTLATCSSPEPFDFSQQSNTSTAKDESTSGTGEMTPELIESVLSNLTDYIRKRDRKRIATEKSRDAWKNKALYLEDEVKRLKDRQKELELIIDGHEYK